eukprot:5958341-Prymnesium_polylepis.1
MPGSPRVSCPATSRAIARASPGFRVPASGGRPKVRAWARAGRFRERPYRLQDTHQNTRLTFQTENTLLCRLIQSYLDETDETGLMLFLDLEKAFDRVSHEYMYEAVKAAGVGTDMLRWIEILYNPASPMQRTTQINGHKSNYFPIRSGVPQGCPLSAILFLFVTEGFSRYLQDAEVSFEGITID